MHDLFREQAARTPGRVAVSCEGAELTYGELLGRARGIAGRLRRLGIGPEDRVGICAERSLEMMAGLLGILEAGAAYVPLDPSYPAERLAYVLEDARVPVVLAQERLAAGLPPHRARLLLLEEPGEPEAAAAVPSLPDSLAYVIYTSGSTGRPKGVMNAHAPVRNRLLWMRQAFALGEDEVFLQKTPFSFDISVWELFMPLVLGARLVMARPGGHQDPAYLVDTIEREGVTTVHFVPSMLRAFLGAPGLERCASLRRVVCGGEALPPDLERRFFARFGAGGPELYNLYGPTEAAVEVTWWRCAPDRPEAPVPIGRPIANTAIRILGPDLEAPAPGEPGELHIGGLPPARGYQGRPDLTAEKFIPDPSSAEPGARLYKTGDLARPRPDGAIEYLGRIDHQVKIRGFRIELGEIESVLAGHPAVAAPVVTAREHHGEPRLVAYVAARTPVGEGELRALLEGRLPGYMVPAAFVFLDALPLTSSGKVDRKALPEPGERARPARVPPRTALERFLARLWEEVLGVERIGRQDSFFDLGGTSISGAVVINRLQGEMAEILHVVALFDAPELAAFAAYLAREHREAVARVWGAEPLPDGPAREAAPARRVDEARLDELRRLIESPAPFPAAEPKNPPILFVLAPPRSGTTLLRVMLGGHPGLFSPPELELLTFNTMAERRAAYPGRDAFWLEGALRAVMEARGSGLEEAREIVAAAERDGWTTRRFYRQLQEWLGGRRLVDKTTTYALDPEVPRRAEEAFEAPFYIHLVRHPYGMIRSFEEARIDQLFFRRPHPFSRRELAELVWTASQRNIAAFLEGIPAGRQHRLRFEDLVRDPEGELRRLCAAIGIEYHPDMADPYKEKQARMTDGLHAGGRMLGDVKFHQHQGVEASAADRWREAYPEDFLGEPTWEMAGLLGYGKPGRTAAAIEPVPRRPGEPLPLSPAQERLWFLEQLAPGSPVYNAAREVRLDGPVDVAALAAALGEIVRRHEVLRTVFRQEADGPVQVVLPFAGLALPVVDLSGVPEAEYRRVSLETARLPFDLTRGPMLRALLVRLGPGEHALRLDLHHIATDGWSMGVLARELEALYGGSSLPEPPVQYADYTLWLRRRLAGPEAAASLEAWRGRLEGLPPLLELPADRPRPAVQSFQGGVETAPLPAGLIAALTETGRRSGATLFMVLLAGFQALLQRYTGRDDLAVGVPSANRSRPEIEGLIGFFVNNLVMRADLSGDPGFETALGRVREAALFAYAHPDLPFERLVAELAPERALAHAPIFQVAFSLQDAPPGQMLDVHTGTAKFDFWLQVGRDEDGWTARAEYAADLFDASTARRMLVHLRTLLEGIAADPCARLSDLPLLSPAEREQVVSGWNRTAAPVPAEPVHRLVERWARATPGAVAIAAEGRRLTYAELNRDADRLARSLRSRGIGPESVVALRLERSPELVTAALATLKAGAAYLPIDPAYPEERLAFVLRDSGASLLPAALDFPVVPAVSAVPEVPSSHLAYLIYTSGSTGVPKGVELCHGGLSSLVAWHRETYGLGPGDRSTLLAGPGFDASVWETWAPLTAGASLHIPPAELVLSPPALLAWMAREGITVSFLPTPLAEAALAEPMPEGFSLRALLTGGDRLRRRPAPDLPFALFNHYGPTESTVVATAGRVSPLAPGAPGAPEIGSPIANTRVYVLDRFLAPVPAGVPGELCLGGEGLARGYRGRPGLTAERFVPDPFGGPGERLYRTGDLGRWLAHGEIEFLGRADGQVKIRGFRVELGEIEAALARHPDVREAAALARAGRLEAFVAVRAAETDAAGLRAWLAERLPDYMIPLRWAFLDSLPLTPNGKVDRRALERLAVFDEEEASADAPRTPMEELVAAAFAEVLGLDRLPGAHEDFFQLGGHSLMAARLASRIGELRGAEVGVRAVFEHPSVAALAAQAGRIEAPPLTPAPRDGAVPLSFAQRRLWFLESLRPGTALYNLPQAWDLRGPLSAPALAAALGGIVRRHEALRTVFADEGEPLQRIEPAPEPFPLGVVDLSGLALRHEEAGRLSAEEVRRPFDLRRGPLFRALLLDLGGEERRLVLGMHHIVSDGVSVGILAREIPALYRAALEGRPSPLAPLAIQYADFAVWQRRGLDGDALAEAVGWWRENLAGAPAALELATDRPRPPIPSLRGSTESLAFGEELAAALERLGRRCGSTRFMTLLAGFQALLHRYSGQEDFLVGSPVAGRDQAGLERLAGFFVNLVPLRADLSGDPSFERFLAATREAALGVYAHQEVPFDRLVEELSPGRDLSRAPLVQVVLQVQDAPPPLDLPGVEAAPVRVHTGTAKFDLTLNLERGEGGLTARMEHAADLFDGGTVRRMLGHLRNLLAGVVADPGTRIGDLPLLDAAERAQLAAFDAAPAWEVPEGELLHGLFEAQAARTPERIAVAAGGETLTYAELEARSARLARRLRRLGVGPEVAVALSLRHTPNLIVAMLAVLRAGGFYVPLDPAYPAERLAYLKKDSGCRLTLTDREVEAAVKDSGAPLPRVLADNLAYLIYTSGSTGRPKAVAIAHRSAVQLAHWAREAFGDGELAGVIASTSITFDMSVFEVFAPLAWGGAVILVDNALAVPALKAPGALPPGIEARLLDTVPSAAAELLRIDGIPATVRTVNLGGEALPRSLADRLRERPGVERLLNLYGPSEDTTFSTVARVEREPERPVSIGRPLEGTRGWVLDRGLRPAPLGVPGELFLAGAGLSRGYLGRPALTAERFLPDPFGGPGERMYRTGDLVRRRTDGELEYLGRLDHQVKIRGFRIELGEVEAALLACPGVEEAVAVAREDRLVAYLAGPAPAAGLRQLLRERLPEPMIPALIVHLDALPRTPNGKVDRNALPAPEPVRVEEEGFAAPRTQVELEIARVWSEVLGIERVGAHDDFWELGGHSLLAVQAVARIGGSFGVDLPLQALFTAPTVAGLAAVISGAVPGRPAPPFVPMEPGAAAPLSFAQERLWFLDRMEPGSAAYNLPILFRVEGSGLKPEALGAALDEMVRRHEVLRTVFRVGSGDDEPAQIVQPFAPRGLTVIDLADLPDATAGAARLEPELARLPFDLARGPLLRGFLLRVSEGDHRLILALHHAVADGWSVGVMVRELSAAYRAFAAGSPPALPPLPVQYAGFAVWQRRWLSGEVLDAELAWWRERLAGAPPALGLPADRPRPAVQSYRGGDRHLALSPETSAALAAAGRRHGSTLFITLLAAFSALLHRLTLEEDLVVGAPVANRGRVELEGLIGLFVNTLALRTSLAGDPTFEELLARTRAAALEAYAHQDLPFEKVVAELAPERDLSRHPLFQVSLTVDDSPIPRLDLGPGLAGPRAPVHLGQSKFDLSLHLARRGEAFVASVEYAADLFDAVTIDRFLGHLSLLLAGITAADTADTARLSEIPLLSGAEQEQLRAAWSGGEAPPPAVPDLYGMVELQARRTPDAVALEAVDGRRWTYAELIARAAAVARGLLELGTGPETRVALCAGRSPEAVIGLLGILRAGGAAVPLDPAHLSDRLAFVLEDSGAALLATTSELSPRLPAPGLPRLLLDLVRPESGPQIHVPAPAESLAYVLYTSGSTGRPKGVAVSHREAAGHFQAAAAAYELRPGDRVPQLASPAFDVSLEEILPTLAAGATLVMRGDDPLETAELAWTVESLGLTVLNLPASLWHLWVHDCEALAAPPAPLRLVVTGSEEVLAEPARRWLRGPLAGVRVLNGYGPTEAVVTATVQEIGAGVLGAGASVPIGRPLPGRSAPLLDPWGHPSPPGVPGELHLGGVLARGYLGRPELTAASFVPDPFGPPGSRLYRTGDLARRRLDGTLEFLGRIDQQVKIRGYRIEPAEIEAALAAFPGVAAAVVLAREVGEDRRLVAFVEAGPEPPSPAELRAFLELRLPAWMIPSAILVIDRLPLRPSGKVDRGALGRLPLDLPAGDRTEPPRTAAERELAALWEEILGVSAIGRDDNFFQLGGHSLLATRVTVRVTARFGVHLALRDFFDRPTLAALAQRLEEALLADGVLAEA
ncbi:MAG: amino acid adenylation domain-containing protein [Thermoanaerobaculia bacterium]